MKNLGVNIDHFATIRRLRNGSEPEPVFAALCAQQAGADSIVAHLREDRRHIRERDVYLIKDCLSVPFNLEMSCAPEIVKIACKVGPNRATLVPEKREEITTEGGLEVCRQKDKLRRVVAKLFAAGIEVSLFIDPLPRQILAARETGAKMIELHTGAYANSKTKDERINELDKLRAAAKLAANNGLSVFAGHGLDYFNVKEIAAIAEIEELNIGYSIVCRSALTGIDKAVRAMRELI